jgi:hypothetical protein
MLGPMRKLAVLVVLLATFATTASAEAKRLVRYDITGGIAGISERLVVDTDGSAFQTGRRGGDQRFTVSAKQLRALKRELKAAHFRSLKRRYEPDLRVFDGTTQTVRHNGRSVSVFTGADVPARLARVLRRLSRVMRP